MVGGGRVASWLPCRKTGRLRDASAGGQGNRAGDSKRRTLNDHDSRSNSSWEMNQPGTALPVAKMYWVSSEASPRCPRCSGPAPTSWSRSGSGPAETAARRRAGTRRPRTPPPPASSMICLGRVVGPGEGAGCGTKRATGKCAEQPGQAAVEPGIRCKQHAWARRNAMAAHVPPPSRSWYCAAMILG